MKLMFIQTVLSELIL